MVTTRNSSARSSSPTPSENSDMYYNDFDRASPSPAPSQTADAFGWESDNETPVPHDHQDTSPTPQRARTSSPAKTPYAEVCLELLPSADPKPNRCEQMQAEK
ncbi:hypothetical protein B0H19DRAFT_1075966 [Mycena capillaripes]|nr:hypothetical protein B0H19DRAFT_1075966 [Mycena capillaripes]